MHQKGFLIDDRILPNKKDDKISDMTVMVLFSFVNESSLAKNYRNQPRVFLSLFKLETTEINIKKFKLGRSNFMKLYLYS